MDHQILTSKGSTLGAILLISGCCIGAGMLGLPVLSAQAGFIPSTLLFIVCWLFMLCTGLLLLEVNSWFRQDINIISLSGHTLGKVGQIITWAVFLFLFYSLMVAYMTGSEELFKDFFDAFFSLSVSGWIGGLVMTAIFGIIIYIGTGAVDRLNRLLMMGLIVTYILLVMLGNKHVNPRLLEHQDWGAVIFVIPAMIVSFGFHNLIPSLTSYLARDFKKLKWAIIIGSFIPLMIYLIWQRIILGIVPLHGIGSLETAMDKGQMATHALKTAVGVSWIVDIAQFFAFFAIVTSFLGVALSFVDFLADGLHIPKKGLGKTSLCLLVLIPPYLFSLIHPGVFLMALNYAGGFGAVIIFGIFPALMVWSGRYRKNFDAPHMVPGGKFVLVLVILFSLAVIALQFYQTIVGLA